MEAKMKMEWNVADYAKHTPFVSQYGEDVLTLLDPQPSERILDLGCGNGELAEKIALKGCEVIGIDSSKEMIAAARKRNIKVFVMSGTEMSYKNEFDAVFSNAALHWIKQSDKVIENTHNALKVGGRFCAEMGGSGNVQIIVAEIYKQLSLIGLDGNHYNPWFFPSKDEYAKQLTQAGFHIEQIEQFDRMTKLATDVAGWLKTVAKPFLQDIPETQHEGFIEAVKDGTSSQLKNEQGEWFADYVRLRFLAVKR